MASFFVSSMLFLFYVGMFVYLHVCAHMVEAEGQPLIASLRMLFTFFLFLR